MPFPEFWLWLQERPLSEYIGFTAWFPFLESIHVLAVGLLVGSILMVDLRLLGLAARRYSASRMARELIPWSWAAFLVAVVTGTGLFLTRASAYVENTPFQIKFLLILLAGINMWFFQFRTFKGIETWDQVDRPPLEARVAGGASLLLWAGVVLAGRWTGHVI